MVLAAKNLPYKKVEVTPGLGQLSIFRLSGQKQVPILVDRENIISDSSNIIRYLEKLNPRTKLLPDDPRERALVHLIEDWADTTMASSARIVLMKAAARDPDLLIGLLPDETPMRISEAIRDLPLELVNKMSDFIYESKGSELFTSLEELSHLIEKHQWIVGNSISVADIALAAQLSMLRFPKSAGNKLAGKGCPGFSDHPSLAHLFDWRDQLENHLMKTHSQVE
tara:strand:+ start:135 stop:809 length:675 start_codon:yes stop_codon:yes gene_type:complete